MGLFGKFLLSIFGLVGSVGLLNTFLLRTLCLVCYVGLPSKFLFSTLGLIGSVGILTKFLLSILGLVGSAAVAMAIHRCRTSMPYGTFWRFRMEHGCSHGHGRGRASCTIFPTDDAISNRLLGRLVRAQSAPSKRSHGHSPEHTFLISTSLLSMLGLV